MTGTGTSLLPVTSHDGITEITLDRPERRNPVNTALHQALARRMTFTGALIDAATAHRVLVAAHRAAFWRSVNLPADEAMSVERDETVRRSVPGATIAARRDDVIGRGRAQRTPAARVAA